MLVLLVHLENLGFVSWSKVSNLCQFELLGYVIFFLMKFCLKMFTASGPSIPQ